MKEWKDPMIEHLKDAPEAIRKQFPEYMEKVDAVVAVLEKRRFRTKYDPLDNPHYETFDPAENLTEPGRSESLQHLVERLTHKPAATMRQMTAYAIQTSQDFEDPSQLTDDQIDDKLEQAVVPGDNIDAAEALAEAAVDFSNAQAEAVAERSKKRATQEQATKQANADASAVPGVSGQQSADAST